MIKKKMMMKRLWNPPEIYYAKGAISALKSLEEKKFLAIIDINIKNSNQYEKIEKVFAEKHVELELFDKITVEQLNELKGKYSAKKVDAIIAIGGGSIIDPAKMLKTMLTFPDLTLEEIEKNQFLEKGSVKLIAIPTTPGTGTEATSVAVIKDQAGNKKPYVNACFIPDLAILDHNFLTTILEPQLMEFCGDIFGHAWEGSISIASSSLLQGLGKASIELLKNGIQNYHTEKQINALGDILYAGHLAGIVQGNAFVGVCHAIAHSLEVLSNVPHAKGILYLCEPIMKWMIKQKDNPLYAEYLAEFEKMGLAKFKDPQVHEKLANLDMNALIDLALKDPAISTTPIRMNKENLSELIQWILQNK